jgi:hypothetical protein
MRLPASALVPRLFIHWFLMLTFSVAALAAPEIRWVPDNSAVEVTGIENVKLPLPDAPAGTWAALFSVRTEGGGADMPAMLGKWTAGGATLRFTPRFPFAKGVGYRATWQPAGENALTSLHKVPEAAHGPPSTVVAHIFPGAETVPENLLKFYLHFSAPMSGGNIYRHIHLRDDAGKEVELPFLELGEELWDREMKRLTLFIDPGRVKREVKPLEDIGPALVTGKRFTLAIDAAWMDANGQPLQLAGEKKFSVGPPDRDPPDPNAWRLTIPAAGSREPLRVAFPETMDHALALRLIAVLTKSGAPVAGEPALSADGKQWSFAPRDAWPKGACRLLIQPELEDLAGNSVGKPFEVDIAGTEKERPAPKAAEIAFDIR